MRRGPRLAGAERAAFTRGGRPAADLPPRFPRGHLRYDPQTQPMSDTDSWTRLLAPYRRPHAGRSVTEIVITAVPFVGLWALTVAAIHFGQYWGLALTLPAAGFLVRLFIIQHDCGHGSFFSRRAANDWVGRVIGVLTLTPYHCWLRAHSIHHATSGNLAKRGRGEILTLTVREYLALSPGRRFAYRLYRHPLVMLVLGPVYLFLFHQRLPFGMMAEGWRPWMSAMGTNLTVAALVTAGIYFLGLGPFLLVHLPIVLIAAMAGGWLFFVQHQFEGASWDSEREWSFAHSALHGSSHYVLPKALAWITGHIGIHHVHHLASRIPFYRLPQVVRDFPQLCALGRVTLLQSLRCIPLAMWCEDTRRLISFRQLRMGYAGAAA